jgi:serine/threonine protein kinase
MPFTVAVKTVRADPALFKTQLSELKTRTEIGPHENIVGLIGANTTNIRNCELELILELCMYGDLENFLESVKVQGLFLNQLNPNGMFQPGRVQALTRVDLTLPMTQSKMMVKTLDLVRWSLHIAKGMGYLHTKKIIHGDLAARNVLLTGDCVAKINNFGLSKHHHSYIDFVRSKELLAWRSLAPECFIGKLVLSFESDVWAYGVTLFEIFSLGERPYSQFDFPDERFLYAIKTGMIPRRPKFVPNRIYAIMQSCWSLDPKQRPTFQPIVAKLEEFMEPILIDNNIQKPVDSDSGVVASDHAIVEIPGH